MYDYKDSPCTIQEGPRRNTYKVSPGYLEILSFGAFGLAVLLSLLWASLSSPSPFFCPQDARRCLLHEILLFLPQNLGSGVASPRTYKGLLLVACNSSLNDIKI